MKLSPLKRLAAAELPLVPRPLVEVLNSFLQGVWQALQGQLTFEENIRCQIIDRDFTGGENLVVASTLKTPVRGIICVKGLQVTDWQQVGEKVEILQVTGIGTGETRRIRLLLI